jgi:hypothetical protein
MKVRGERLISRLCRQSVDAENDAYRLIDLGACVIRRANE